MAKVTEYYIQQTITYNKSHPEVSDSGPSSKTFSPFWTKAKPPSGRIYSYGSDGVWTSYETAKILDTREVESGSSGGYTPPSPTNKPPVISGEDRDLGQQNKPFYFEYMIEDPDSAEVRVDISLNQEVIETIQNVQKSTVLRFDITETLLKSLTVGELNYIVITATDGDGAKAYRNLTFTRVNAPPKVTLEASYPDENRVDVPFSITYVAVDDEEDSLSAMVFLDGSPMLAESKPITGGQQELYEIPRSTFFNIAPGAHVISVQVTDDKGQTGVAEKEFNRVADEIIVYLDPPVSSSVAATKIQNTYTMFKGGNNVTVKVEACNNANDPSPAWEEITSAVEAKEEYTFLNTTFVNDPAINIRFTVKSNGTPQETQFKGFGGAFS